GKRQTPCTSGNESAQSSGGSPAGPHLAVPSGSWLSPHVGFARLYGNDVGTAERPRASLQSALHRAVSRPPGSCGSSRTLDRGDSQVDLVTVAARPNRLY